MNTPPVSEKRDDADPLASTAESVSEQRRHVLRFVWTFVRDQKTLVFLALAANLGASVFEGTSMAFLYFAISLFIDSGVDSQVAGWLSGAVDKFAGGMDKQALFISLVALVAVAQILQSALSYAGNVSSVFLRMRVRRALMKGLVAQIMDLSFPAISRYRSGELWSLVTMGKAVEKLIGDLNNGLYTALMAAAYCVVLLMLSWKMTLAALVLMVLLSLGLKVVMRKIHHTAENNLDIMRKMNMSTADLLAGMRIIRSFGMEGRMRGRIDGHIDRSSDMLLRGSIWEGLITPIIDVATILTIVLVMTGLSLIYADGFGAVLPTVLVFVFVVARLIPRLGNLNRVRAALHASWPTVVYSTEFLRKDNKHLDRRDGKPFGGLKTGLEFRGVSLEYTITERSAVRGLDFTLPRGGTLAIVGESGAGKSSVVDMILGLFEPTEGEILIDGVPLSEIDMKSWRQRIGIVNQDTFMFAANIRDNIAFARPDASEEEVIAAARVAQAHDFIREMENGYDTVLGDRGYRLSGGQRQRLALARAFVRNPDLLILDEATSDLDSNSERLLQKALERFGSDRTVIMIAHRLSTVRNADNILVMSEGRVVESGRHDDLVASGGIYANLWRIQAGDKAGETT